MNQETIYRKLICYKLKNLYQTGLNNSYFIEINSTRKNEPKYIKIFFENKKDPLLPNAPLIGDFCLQIFQ